jgi:hypothetical protein
MFDARAPDISWYTNSQRQRGAQAPDSAAGFVSSGTELAALCIMHSTRVVAGLASTPEVLGNTYPCCLCEFPSTSAELCWNPRNLLKVRASPV